MIDLLISWGGAVLFAVFIIIALDSMGGRRW